MGPHGFHEPQGLALDAGLLVEVVEGLHRDADLPEPAVEEHHALGQCLAGPLLQDGWARQVCSVLR